MLEAKIELYQRQEKKGKKGDSSHPIKNLQKEKKENLPPLIIDNINKKFNTEESIRKELDRCIPNIKINKIKRLPKGGVLIFPESSVDYNKCLKDWPEDSFDSNISVHVPASQDMRPTLCLIKFDLDLDIKIIKEKLEEKSINCEELKRLINHKGRETTLIIFKVENEQSQYHLEKNGLQIEGVSYTVRKYIKKNIQVQRCIKCQRLGHNNKNCKFNRRCVRCSGTSCGQECTKEILKCSNCGEQHSSAYKGCRVYHQALKENEQKHQIKTYAEIAKSTDQTIEKELSDIKTKIKSQYIITPTDLIIVITEAIVYQTNWTK